MLSGQSRNNRAHKISILCQVEPSNNSIISNRTVEIQGHQQPTVEKLLRKLRLPIVVCRQDFRQFFCLLIFLICSSNILNTTEIYPTKSITSLSSSSSPFRRKRQHQHHPHETFHETSELSPTSPLLTYDRIEDLLEMQHAGQLDEIKFRFKVSPTRIRFSNAKPSYTYGPPGNTVPVRNLQPANYVPPTTTTTSTSATTTQHTVSFANLKSKRLRQMAPAYELWPDLHSSINQVRLETAKKFDQAIPKPYSELPPPAPSQPVLPRSELQLSVKAGRYTNILPSNLNGLRNLLPKPVTLIPSDSISSSRFVRAPTGASGSNGSTATKGKLDQADSLPEEEQATDSEDSNGAQSEADSVQEADGADTDTVEVDSDSDIDKKNRPINFKIFNDGQAIVELGRQTLPQSQVYPPGDLDRLYSDALLVYVKDFN